MDYIQRRIGVFLHRIGIPGWSSFHMKYTSDSEALDRKLW